MTAAYLRSLCDQIQPGRGVLPVMGGRAEPLAAIYPIDARPYFLEALRGANYSLQALTRLLVQADLVCVVRIGREDEKHFRNLNEPADTNQVS